MSAAAIFSDVVSLQNYSAAPFSLIRLFNIKRHQVSFTQNDLPVDTQCTIHPKPLTIGMIREYKELISVLNTQLLILRGDLQSLPWSKVVYQN